MKNKLPILLVAAAAAGPLAAVPLLLGGGSDPAPAPDPAAAVTVTAPADGHDHAGDPAHQKPAFIRTLAVSTRREPPPTADPRHMRGQLVSGRMPAGVVHATVMTDENCEADRRGVSHCRNRLRLPDGREITVRHPHRMADVPCMTPGETVRMGRAVGA